MTEQTESHVPALMFPVNSREAFETFCRSRASALYVGKETILCRVFGNLLCYVDSNDTAVAPHLAMDGFWEAWNSVAVARLIRPGWRVVDVGANHGYYTLLLASLVGPTGHVFALEPNPQLFELLERTIALNGFRERVTALPYAAAATEEEVELHIPRHFSSNGSVSLSPIGASTSCRVQQRRLDQLIEGPLDFLKIDAEGADYDALEGAANLLNAGGSAVLLEHYAPFYAFPEERLGKWIDEGFALHYINDRGDSTPTTLQYLARERERFWHVWLSRANA